MFYYPDQPRPELLISIHIPKTAGTTFGSLLQKNYGPHFLYVYNTSAGEDLFCVGHTLTELTLNQKDEVLNGLTKSQIYNLIREKNIKCIHGHFPYSWVADARNHFKNVKYVTWVRDPITRACSDYLHHMRNNYQGDQEILLKNISNIMTAFTGKDLSVFSFIGRTEHFDEDLKRFGIDEKYTILNFTRETLQDAHVKARIKDYVGEDRDLYNQVCRDIIR